MRYDSVAAAYGLFQLAYAELAQHLVAVLHELTKDSASAQELSKLITQPFGAVLGTLRAKLKALHQDGWEEDTPFLFEALQLAEDVQRWRNERVHCAVRRTDSGLVLVNRKSGVPLEMTVQDIEENIDRAIKATVLIRAYGSKLSRSITNAQEIEALIDQLYSEIESERDEEFANRGPESDEQTEP